MSAAQSCTRSRAAIDGCPTDGVRRWLRHRGPPPPRPQHRENSPSNRRSLRLTLQQQEQARREETGEPVGCLAASGEPAVLAAQSVLTAPGPGAMVVPADWRQGWADRQRRCRWYRWRHSKRRRQRRRRPTIRLRRQRWEPRARHGNSRRRWHRRAAVWGARGERPHLTAIFDGAATVSP